MHAVVIAGGGPTGLMLAVAIAAGSPGSTGFTFRRTNSGSAVSTVTFDAPTGLADASIMVSKDGP